MENISAHGFLWETWVFKIIDTNCFLWEYGNIIYMIKIFGNYFISDSQIFRNAYFLKWI
jgi:hypothetical protein